jgi:hypothetical protein
MILSFDFVAADNVAIRPGAVLVDKIIHGASNPYIGVLFGYRRRSPETVLSRPTTSPPADAPL